MKQKKEKERQEEMDLDQLSSYIKTLRSKKRNTKKATLEKCFPFPYIQTKTFSLKFG